MNNNELYHHGILGMKWGRRNGPPYPLSSSAHSASEKKAGWRKSLDKEDTKKKAKKIAKGAAVVGGITAIGAAASKAKGSEKSEKSDKWFNKTIKQGKGNEPVSPAEKITREVSKSTENAAKVARVIEKAKAGKTPRESKELSTEELRKRVNRLQLEQRYEELNSKDLDYGRVKVSEVLDAVGGGSAILASGVTIYALLKGLGKVP